MYEALLMHCHETGLLPPTVKKGELVVYYSDGTDQLFVLPNGALFMTESLLEALL